MEKHEKDRHKTRWAKLSVASNALLVAFKLAVGLSTGSVSIVAEAVHSANDLLAAIIAFLAVKKSAKPADENHAFGHGKFENLAGLSESVLIVLAGGAMVYQSAQKLLHPVGLQMVDLGIGVMGMSAVVNYLVSRKLIRVARETDSVALETDGSHLLVDVYTSLGVMGGLLLIRLTKLQILDPIISICVALYIVYLGLHLSIKSARDLLDEQLPPDEVQTIRKLLQSDGNRIASFHGLATRKSAGTRMVEVHLVVCSSWSVKEGHDAGVEVRRTIDKAFSGARMVFHIDPCDKRCGACTMADCSGRSVAVA